MNQYFSNISYHSTDFYIVDYTQQTNSTRGVEISETPFTDINCCTIKNSNNIECLSINFDKNQSVFRIEGSSTHESHSECMIASKHANRKSWICLIELKYCLEKNIDTNTDNALCQLIKCFEYLKNKGIIDLKKHHVYVNISIPDHSNKQPFQSFQITQNKIIDLKKTKSIHLLRYNVINILNEAYLSSPLSQT